ncbi:MAG TPA: hypothetical protein VNK24_00555 [Elusimicrobiota bacterium]|nr:hypothetical protein [Elusimicrobiota bacterium]
MNRDSRAIRALSLFLSAGLVLASPGAGVYAALAAEVAPVEGSSAEGAVPALISPEIISQSQGMMFNGMDAGDLLEGLSCAGGLSPQLAQAVAPVLKAEGSAPEAEGARRNALEALTRKAAQERRSADRILASEPEKIAKANAAGLEKSLSRLKLYEALLSAPQREKIAALERRLAQHKEDRIRIGIGQAAAAWGTRMSLAEAISIGAVPPKIRLADSLTPPKSLPGRLRVYGADREALGAALLKLNLPAAPAYLRSGGAFIDFKNAEEAAKAAVALAGLDIISSVAVHPDVVPSFPKAPVSKTPAADEGAAAEAVPPILMADRLAVKEELSGNRLDAQFSTQEDLARWGGKNVNEPRLYFFMSNREAAIKRALELLDDPHLTRLEVPAALRPLIERRLDLAPSEPMPLSEELLRRLRVRPAVTEEKSVNIHFADPLSADSIRSFLERFGIGKPAVIQSERVATPDLFSSLEAAAEKTIALLRQKEIAYIRVAKSLADVIAERVRDPQEPPAQAAQDEVPDAVLPMPENFPFGWNGPGKTVEIVNGNSESETAALQSYGEDSGRSGLPRFQRLAAAQAYRETILIIKSLIEEGRSIDVNWRMGSGRILIRIRAPARVLSPEAVRRLKAAFAPQTVVGHNFRAGGGRIFYEAGARAGIDPNAPSPETGVLPRFVEGKEAAIWIEVPGNGPSSEPPAADNSDAGTEGSSFSTSAQEGHASEPQAQPGAGASSPASKVAAFDTVLHPRASAGRVFVSAASAADARAALNAALGAAGFGGVPVMTMRHGAPSSYQAFATLAGARDAARLALALAASAAISAVAVHPEVYARVVNPSSDNGIPALPAPADAHDAPSVLFPENAGKISESADITAENTILVLSDDASKKREVEDLARRAGLSIFMRETSNVSPRFTLKGSAPDTGAAVRAVLALIRAEGVSKVLIHPGLMRSLRRGTDKIAVFVPHDSAWNPADRAEIVLFNFGEQTGSSENYDRIVARFGRRPDYWVREKDGPHYHGVAFPDERAAAQFALELAAEPGTEVRVSPEVLILLKSQPAAAEAPASSPQTRAVSTPKGSYFPASNDDRGGLKEFLIRLLAQEDTRSPGVRYAAAETLAAAAPNDVEWAREILSSDKMAALYRYYPEAAAAAGILARSGAGAEDARLVTEAIRRAEDSSIGGDNYNPLRLALAESLAALLKPETREEQAELMRRYQAARQNRTTEKEALFLAAARWGGPEFKEMLMQDWVGVTGAGYSISTGIAQAERAKVLYRYLQRVAPKRLEELYQSWRGRGAWGAPPADSSHEVKRDEALALYAAADLSSDRDAEAAAKKMRDMIDGFSSVEQHMFFGVAAGQALEKLLATRRIFEGSEADLRRHLGHYLAVSGSLNVAKLVMVLSAVSASSAVEDEAMVFRILDGVSSGYGELAQHEAAQAWAKMAARSGRIRGYLAENETDENGRPISKIEKMLTDPRPFINKAALEAVKFHLQYQAAASRRRRRYP